MKKLAAFLTMLFALAVQLASAQHVLPSVAPAGNGAASSSADSETVSAVAELLEAFHYRQVIKSGLEQIMTSAPALIRETVTAEISNSNLTPQKKKEGLEKVEMMLPKLAAAVRTERGDPAMTEEIITEIVKRCARQRTTQEIRQLGAFYKSPAGAKWLTKLPQIVNESMLINQHVVSTSPRKRLSAIKRSVVI